MIALLGKNVTAKTLEVRVTAARAPPSLALVAVPDPSSCAVAEVAGGCTLLVDTAYVGIAISTSSTPSVAACCAACAKLPACAFFTATQSKAWPYPFSCALLSAMQRQVKQVGTTSGSPRSTRRSKRAVLKHDDQYIHPHMSVVPAPKSYTAADGAAVPLAAGFSFVAHAGTGASLTLTEALARYTVLLLTKKGDSATGAAGAAGATGAAGAAGLASCSVAVAAPPCPPSVPWTACPAMALLFANESYKITISAADCSISAPTVYGAMWAMETVVQLVISASACAPYARACPAGLVVQPGTVTDAPRWPFRATMIDTSRHYYEVGAILKQLDAMAAAKFNVLHW